MSVRNDLASPHNGHMIRDRQYFLELMGDEQDGNTAGFEGAQNAEKLVRLLRRQHAGWFVEDENGTVAKQGF